MAFSRPFQWYHSHADPLVPDGIFKGTVSQTRYIFAKINVLGLYTIVAGFRILDAVKE